MFFLQLFRGGSRTGATSKMERFVIIVNGFTKRSILDVAATLDLPMVVSRSTIHICLITRYVLGRICSTTSCDIHFVFDKIIHPWIRDCERDARSSDGLDSYNITGSSQKRPGNWLADLCNDHFKSSLIQYLISAWDNNSRGTITPCLWTITMIVIARR